MKKYEVAINNNEDFDLIENINQRRESKEHYRENINLAEEVLEAISTFKNITFDRIDNYRFDVDVPDNYNIYELENLIEKQISEIYYVSIEEYEEV